MARARTAPAEPVFADPLGGAPDAPADTPATAVLFNDGFAPTWAQLASGLVRLAARESLTVLRSEVTGRTRSGAAQGDFSIRFP